MKSKRFEQSNGLDNALCKNIPFSYSVSCVNACCSSSGFFVDLCFVITSMWVGVVYLLCFLSFLCLSP